MGERRDKKCFLLKKNSMEALLQCCSKMKQNILVIFNELFTIKNENTDHTGKVKEISCRWANFTIW